MSGCIEPRRGLLRIPDDDVRLFKVMRLDHFLDSVRHGYLYFRRVDSYGASAGADPDDGRQLPSDVSGNRASAFLRQPDFTASEYYDTSRSRSFACCFTTSDGCRVLSAYGSGDPDGKARVSFLYGLMMDRVRRVLSSEDAAASIGGTRLIQCLDLDAGFVNYVDRDTHRENDARLTNTITYIFTKDQQYAWESEVRLSLSTGRIGRFQTKGQPFIFPDHIRLPFDYRAAKSEGGIVSLERHSRSSCAQLSARVPDLGLRFDQTE